MKSYVHFSRREPAGVKHDDTTRYDEGLYPNSSIISENFQQIFKEEPLIIKQ